MARLSPREAVVELQSRLTGEGRRLELVRLAHQAIGEAARINVAAGASGDYDTVVDGRRDAPIEAVQPGGTVVAIFASHLAAIDLAIETILRISPVKTGRFRDSNRILVNGEERIAPVLGIGPADTVVLTNLQPYARKIERGDSEQAPNGVYEVTAAIVKARFGNVVDIKFSYGAYLGATAGTAAGGKRSDHARQARFPSITFRPKRRR